MGAFIRCFGVALFGLASAWSSAASTRVEGGNVYVNEVLVASFSGARGAARAQALAAAVTPLSRGGSIRVIAKKRSAKLVCGSQVALTLTRDVAAAYGSTPAGLANSLAAKLRSAVDLPPIKLERTSVQLGSSGVVSMKLVGSAVRKAVVEVEDGSIASAVKGQGTLTVYAKTFGSTNVVVGYGDAIASLAVKVSPASAMFPQTVSAMVSGSPASISTVRSAISGAIYNQLRTRPEANLTFRLPPLGQLGSGGTTNVPVKVMVSAPDCLPAEGVVNVQVRNLGLGQVQEGELWYCNDPENVKGPGLLFSAELKKSSPARVLYHHYNASPGGLFIDVTAINDTDKPAHILVMPGDGKPDKNPVLAGAEAGEQFVRSWLIGSGEVLTIPPRSTIPLAMGRLAPRETMSGLCYLRLLDDSPDQISVVAAAKAPFGLDARWALANESSAPWRYVGPQRISGLTPKVSVYSDHIYPNPFKTEEVTYQVGGRYAFVRIGEKAIPRFDNRAELSGNFGVMYTIKAKVENPSDLPVDIEMCFEASAGYSGGIFVVNGELKRTPLIQPKSEVPFAKVRLDPGAVKTYTILTVPLSGSSYPATLTIRPTETALPRTIGHR
ncbi:MAG: hypothetical protein U0S12_00995 [Fimbriimonadales bacterium]